MTHSMLRAGDVYEDDGRKWMEVWNEQFSATPESYTLELNLPFNTNSGTSFYFYFDVMGFRDIGNFSSQLHYKVYIHQRSTAMNVRIYDLLGSHTTNEFFEFYRISPSNGDQRFLIHTAEDYSGISVLGYDRDSSRSYTCKGRLSNVASSDGGAYITNNSGVRYDVYRPNYTTIDL